MRDCRVIEILSNAEMGNADALTIASGVPGIHLMEAAGAAVADRALAMMPSAGPVLVICGPGNNGGDGFVAARLLAERGHEVRLALIGDRRDLKGDAALAAARWKGEVRGFDPSLIPGCGLIIDALYGTGLSRDVDGVARAAIEAVNAAEKPVLAVDIPSGVDGDTGLVRGVAVQATATATFFRLKTGHKLLPGRVRSGEIHLSQIGISESVLEKISPRTCLNGRAQWDALFPRPNVLSHKYSRGHVLAAGGSEMTGAARLAVRAAIRAGAGVVTVAVSPDVLSVYQITLDSVIVRAMETPEHYAELLTDERRNVLLLGPGLGHGSRTRDLVRLALASGRAVVLDADALTSFENQPRSLFDVVKAADRPVIMTPHEGEFRRLFAKVFSETPSKLDRARGAAAFSGAIVVFKGADTVIAAPDGRAAITDNAPPWLATAGAGDVLAGIISGIVAQGMPGFEAACAGVWIHGECGNEAGPGLASGDLPDALQPVLRRLFT